MAARFPRPRSALARRRNPGGCRGGGTIARRKGATEFRCGLESGRKATGQLCHHDGDEDSRLGPYCRLSERAPGLQNDMRQKLELGERNSSPRYRWPSRFRRVVTTLHCTDCLVFSLSRTTVWSGASSASSGSMQPNWLTV